jgi:hypothetical protein
LREQSQIELKIMCNRRRSAAKTGEERRENRE